MSQTGPASVVERTATEPASERTSPTPRPLPASAGNGDSYVSILEQRRARRKRGDGAGFGISLIVHTVLLLVLSIPVIGVIREVSPMTTVVTDASSRELQIVPLETAALSSELAGSATDSPPIVPEMVASEVVPLTQGVLNSGGIGAGTGPVSDSEDDSAHERMPANAARAGRFSAWTTPVGRWLRRTGEPGESPRPGQAYRITIELDVPDDWETYPVLTDLTGTITGSDGHTQSLPLNTYIVRRDGDLILARGPATVRRGVVQVYVFVPGGAHLVKDTIRLESQLLGETQTLELVFDSGAEN